MNAEENIKEKMQKLDHKGLGTEIELDWGSEFHAENI